MHAASAQNAAEAASAGAASIRKESTAGGAGHAASSGRSDKMTGAAGRAAESGNASGSAAGSEATRVPATAGTAGADHLNITTVQKFKGRVEADVRRVHIPVLSGKMGEGVTKVGLNMENKTNGTQTVERSARTTCARAQRKINGFSVSCG